MKGLAVLVMALLIFLPVQSIQGFQLPASLLLQGAEASDPSSSFSVNIDETLSNPELLALYIQNTASDINVGCVRWNVYSDTGSLLKCYGLGSCCEDFSLQSEADDWATPLHVTEGIGSQNLVVADIVYSFVWEEVTSGIVPTKRSVQKQAFVGLVGEGTNRYYKINPVDNATAAAEPSAVPTTEVPSEAAAGEAPAPVIATDTRIPLNVNYKFSENDVVELRLASDVSKYSYVCSIWDIGVGSAEKKLCYGSSACCNLVNIPSSEGVWDTTLYLSKATEGIGESNLITVYVMGSVGDILPGQLHNIQSSEMQRLEVTLPNTQAGASGSVQLIQPEQELQGVYMELPEESSGTSANISVELSPVVQGEIEEGMPVKWYQEINLTNNGQQETSYTLSLWSHADLIGIDFLSEVTSFKISTDEDLISESSVALLTLLPGEQKKLEITYETPPVMIERNCVDITLAQLLPPEATVTGSELPLDTPVKTVCTIRVYHNTITHYKNIKVSLPDIDPNSIESIYFVEGNTYLQPNEGAITVPES